MGKKEKSGKKKGSLKMLSKCLFFWGNKRNSRKGSKQDSHMKRAHSESSVANTTCSENVMPAASDVDPTNVGECSSSHSHSHFQLYCDTTDTSELQNSKIITPDTASQHPDAEGSAITDLESSNNKRTTESDTQKGELYRKENDKSIKTTNTKCQRFIITAVSENKDCNDTYLIRSREIEATVKTKNKEIKEPQIYESDFNRVVEHNSKSQICQPNSNSTKDFSSQSSKPQISQQNISLVANYTNNVVTKQAEQVCQPSLDSVNHSNGSDVQQSEPQICQPCLISTDNVTSQPSETQAGKSSFIAYNFNSEGMHHSEPQIGQSSRSPSNYVQRSEPLKSSLSSNSLTDENLHQLKPQTDQPSPSNHTDGIQESRPPLVLKSFFSLNNYSKDNVAHQPESQNNEDIAIHEEKSNTHSTNFSVDNYDQVQVLVDDRREKHDDENLAETAVLINESNNLEVSSEEKHNFENLEVATIPIKESIISSNPEESLTNHSILSSAKDDNHLDVHQFNINRHEPITDKEKSNIDSPISVENIKDKLTITPNIEDTGNYLTSQFYSSSDCANSQVVNSLKDETFIQAAEQNTCPPAIDTCDGGCLANKSKTQLLENYPSVNLINGTPEIGMTLVVLPYMSPGNNENWKVLSNLTTKGNCQKSDNSSDIQCNKEKQISTTKTELPTLEEKVTSNRHTSAIPLKQSRLPIRRSEDIEDKISKLSSEIEEINSNIKQKTVNSRSSSANRSRSKIPRKCASNSASPYCK